LDSFAGVALLPRVLLYFFLSAAIARIASLLLDESDYASYVIVSFAVRFFDFFSNRPQDSKY
jgi:hypothetical protein